MTVTERREPMNQAEPGWHPDPNGQHHLRYHNGMTWTEHVTHLGPTPCFGCRRSLPHHH